MRLRGRAQPFPLSGIGLGVIGALGLGLGVPSPASASPPALPSPAGDYAPDPQAIVGGQASEPCAWPSVVALQGGGLCTGTLIHPRVVAYAAHCGTFHARVFFGEDADNPAREVETLTCERATPLSAVSSMDYAYCVLAEPVLDIAPTPPLIGCDENLIAIGTPVTIVGFGDTTSEGPASTGLKHEAQTEIRTSLSTVGIGGMGTGADSGDSGGPAFVELDDGSWRLLGLVSGGGGDGGVVQYVPAPLIVPWIEAQTGIDVSPCHTGAGAWAPTPACEGFHVSTEPGASWARGCPGTTSPASERCGPPWTSIEDLEPPTVAFVDPLDGEALLGPPLVFDVLGEADDGEGIGGVELGLFIDGAPVLDEQDEPALDQVPPYEFSAIELDSAGEHTLTLEARDALGNTSEATITVLVGGPGDEGGASESGESEAGGTQDDTGGAGPALEGGAGQGCGCRHEPGPGRAKLAMLVALLGLGLGSGLRRRRRGRGIGRRRGPSGGGRL